MVLKQLEEINVSVQILVDLGVHAHLSALILRLLPRFLHCAYPELDCKHQGRVQHASQDALADELETSLLLAFPLEAAGGHSLDFG